MAKTSIAIFKNILASVYCHQHAQCLHLCYLRYTFLSEKVLALCQFLAEKY